MTRTQLFTHTQRALRNAVTVQHVQYSITRWQAVGTYRGRQLTTRSTQPCIHPGSINRVPASAGLRAGMSPLPGGR